MFWKKPKPLKGLSSEQWVTERAARNSPDWEAEQSYRDVHQPSGEHSRDGRKVNTEQFRHEYDYDPALRLNPEERKIYDYKPVEGQVLKGADGNTYVYGSGSWKPYHFAVGQDGKLYTLPPGEFTAYENGGFVGKRGPTAEQMKQIMATPKLTPEQTTALVEQLKADIAKEIGKMPGRVACPDCEGTGAVDDPMFMNGRKVCGTCRGEGTEKKKEPCPQCQGHGEVMTTSAPDWVVCSWCQGSGVAEIRAARKFHFKSF